MAVLSLLDTVATLKPIPSSRLSLVESEYQSIENLPARQVGTIVSIYPSAPPIYLVEFSDSQGREYAMATLTRAELNTL